MIEFYNLDAWKFIKSLPDQSVGAIITDPMYDSSLDMGELRRICKGHIITFCAPENPYFVPSEYAYWIKPPSTKNNAGSKKLSRFVEWILIERRGETFNTGLHWSNYTGVYDDRLLTKQIHPFEKPLSLLERLIAIYTKPGDLVFDPFFGSGSTLKAAARLGRRAIGTEIDKGYYDLFCEYLGKDNEKDETDRDLFFESLEDSG
jgi:DNA modification methylase